jgi:hypothetical protein
MSTRNLSGSKGRPALKADDNLIATCEPVVYKCGSLDVSKPYESARPVIGTVLPFTFLISMQDSRKYSSYITISTTIIMLMVMKELQDTNTKD